MPHRPVAACLAVLAIALNAAPSLGAAPEMEKPAAALLDRVGVFYRGLDAFAVEIRLTMTRRRGDRTRTRERTARLRFERPNRIAIEPTDDRGDQATLVSNGERVLVAAGAKNRHAIFEAPDTMEALLENQTVQRALAKTLARPVLAFTRAAPKDALLARAKRVVHLGRVDAGEGPKAHRIRIVRQQGPPMMLRFSGGEQPLLQKAILKPESRKGSLSVSFTYTNWRLNPAFDAAVFAPQAPADSEKTEKPFAAGRGSAAKALEGKPAPGFELDRLDGDPVKLEDHEGEAVVVLDFFATWCAPCRKAMPRVADAVEGARERGAAVRFYAVNLREPPAKARRFMKKLGLADIRVLLDRDGTVAERYRVRGIPQTVVIDKDGTVRVVHLGLVKSARLRSQIVAAASGAGASKDEEPSGS